MCETRSEANTKKDHWQSKTHFQITFIFSDVNVGARNLNPLISRSFDYENTSYQMDFNVASPSRQTNRDAKWETYCNS
jgi:hypothetical protein